METKPIFDTTVNNHEICLKMRKAMSISGVKEIISFDEHSVVLSTVCGDMSVDGENIHISVLDVEKGVVAMDGRINSVYYYDVSETDKRSFLSKIFK